MKKELWIVAEQNNGVVASSYYELLSKAKQVYANSAFTPCFTAVALCADDSVKDVLISSGADKVICCVHEKLSAYHPTYYTSALAALAQEKKPEIILTAASSMGSELAPGVAAKLNTGLAAHCTDLSVDEEGVFHMMIPAFGGKLMGDDIIPTSRPIMASIKPGVFDRTELPTIEAEIEVVTSDILDTLESGIELVDIETLEIERKSIDKAEVIVCGGLGAGSSGSVDKLQQFADCIGASVGYTRPLVDLGYFPNENDMIGTSGKTVKPKLYIGFGVSGASHHSCGMKDSGLIININNDEEADCFDISNYKVVADCSSFLDELLNQMK